MLDIQLEKLLENMRAAGVPDFADVPPEVARGIYSQFVSAGDVPVADVDIEERRIEGPGGELALRIYRPRDTGGLRGAVLYLHGGGFVVGQPQDYDGVASVLCAQSGCVLAQVDYRLAPEHPFPAAVDDSYAALVLLAGYDPLHDEGVAYADKLAAAGTHVTLIDYAGLAHGFVTMGGALDAARVAVDQVANVLRRALAVSTEDRAPV